MKERELREHSVCCVCKQKIGRGGPTFSILSFDVYTLNIEALQRQQGLTMFLGGSASLAQVMGPNEDMADLVSSTKFTLCGNCSDKILTSLDNAIGEIK